VLGAVVVNVDIGGIARAYRDTYWVHADGTYLGQAATGDGRYTAFADFPGLAALFEARELALWEGPQGERVIWVPLLATEEDGPLWVGRRVDSAPISSVSRALQWRIGLVLVALVAVILVAARWIATRAEHFRGELTDGVTRILEQGEPVRFSWRGSRELHELGGKLSRLAREHAENVEELRAHARKREESNRYKSEFLANVSHELRTPLNSILLLSKLLAEDPARLEEEQRKQADVIHSAGRDLQALIEDILDLSRIEARRTVFHLEHVYLEELVVELVELLHAQAESKGLYLEREVAEGIPEAVVTDPDKLRQILKNFLSNAIKFTERGGVRITLDPNPWGDAEHRPLRITVADTGIGIPEDKHQLIFQAFQQADGSTSRRYGGTGLGLTISRELARLMGGRIHLESTPGAGARFSLLLPAEFDRSWLDEDQYVSEGGEETRRGEPVVERGLPEADFSGRTVLLVDDDLRNLLTLTPLFERWGCSVLAAGDGQEALETLISEGPVDLVLLDLMMPGMDGEETLANLRADGRFEATPIIVLTAKALEDTEAEAERLGLAAVLVKPLDADRLRGLLQRLWA
jgi:signal transduction histidine kinase